MILPTKHISPERSLLGLGAVVISHLERPATVTELWNATRTAPGFGTFERFSLSLGLLFAIGIVEIADGLVRRKRP
jgi:hypothetical protein